MRRFRFLALFTLIAAVALLASCASSSSAPDFVGTWQAAPGSFGSGSSGVFTITETSMTVDINYGPGNGTEQVIGAISATDETAKTFLVTVSADTVTPPKTIPSNTVPSTLYFRYLVTGSTMVLADGTGAYPADTSTGFTLTKQ